MHAHLDDFMAGRAQEFLQLKDLASILCQHPGHVSNVIKLHTGFHPYHFYELRIVQEAKTLLADLSLPVQEVAGRLTYDASIFTKFFKAFVGMTPTEYRRTLHVPSQALPRPTALLLAA